MLFWSFLLIFQHNWSTYVQQKWTRKKNCFHFWLLVRKVSSFFSAHLIKIWRNSLMSLGISMFNFLDELLLFSSYLPVEQYYNMASFLWFSISRQWKKNIQNNKLTTTWRLFNNNYVWFALLLFFFFIFLFVVSFVSI